ncbi:NrtA/SsuA/CpmA family ABC transporter substrate-binding protein [Telmatospirillum siberiense]|uniref:Putative aliphatic sulfonates-binding protein n=1 Tax=Telmatospirillum siberiense TaxID=382514 RepID=A0A2N3PNT6_9PROT|nr:NrtA/SsuA/CpmA family ABC transporter substrate-binding protein [Telmatospirillum siberiense]PKU22073.1 sulfonate ABC transporter substrate-binding protein [Telmatospirillum siberiense]
MPKPSSFWSRREFLRTLAIGAGSAGVIPAVISRPAAGRTTDRVRLTYARGGLTLIAKERGELDKRLSKEGIKVEWVGPFPNHAPTLQAVTGGSADFSFGGSTTPALAAIIAGAPLVFTQFYHYDPRTTAIIARKDTGIETVKDLIGKTVAVNRSGLGEFLLIAALEKHGIERSKVNAIYLNPPDAATALAAGKIDAWAMWSPAVDIARVEYQARDVFNEGRDLNFAVDYSSFLTSRDFAAANPDLVRAVNAAFAAEGAWASANVRESEEISQQAGQYKDEVRDYFIGLKRQYRFYAVNDTSFVTRLQTAADWLTDRSILTERITVAGHVARL